MCRKFPFYFIISLADIFCNGTTFSNSADFIGAEFNNSADFSEVKFKDSANFNGATFNNFADFTGTTFNDIASFYGPSEPAFIIADGQNIQKFTKYYNDIGKYEYADIVYYNYRLADFRNEDFDNPSFWTDFLSWLFGFGVKPFIALYFGIFIIVLFSGIYANPICFEVKRKPIRLSLNVSFDRIRNKIIPYELSLKKPGVVKNDQNQKTSLLDVFYYSVGTFNPLSSGSWCQPRENFKKWVILEGLIGWAFFVFFSASLSHILMRV